MHTRSYYTLIASLPNLPPRYDVERTPITLPRLRERLKLLHDADAEVIDQVSEFLAWDRQPLDRTDEEVMATYKKLMDSISNPLVRQLINQRIDIRTIVSALRRRQAGSPPPPGIGQLVDHIRRNFTHPEFNLHGRYPWIGELDGHLKAGKAQAAQRLLFDVGWRMWCQLAEQYTFSFEAVILYLAKWEIIDRWTSQDVTVGRERFEQLITETLGDYAKLY